MTDYATPVSLQDRDESDDQEPPLGDNGSARVATDSAIARGLQAGDSRAWATLYDTYSVRIWRYIARGVGADASGVADLVQETLMAAAQSARQFDMTKGTLWQWLTGIAHYRVAQYWREQSRHRRVFEQLQKQTSGAIDSGWQQLLAATAAPESQLLQQELADIVRLTLSQLSSEHAELLTAKYLEEWSIKEIELHTGRSSDAVRSKLLRARKEFRVVYERLVRDHRSS